MAASSPSYYEVFFFPSSCPAALSRGVINTLLFVGIYFLIFPKITFSNLLFEHEEAEGMDT